MSVFISGGTGFLGRPLVERLIASHLAVTVLVRPGSESRVPPGPRIVVGDPFDGAGIRPHLQDDDTFVHLLGTSHPAPWKGRQFREVDLASLRASLVAANRVRLRQLVYLSVAHPAPVMRAYTTVRAQCEALIRASGHRATILRPWYVLGPGRRWPLVLTPLYRTFERVPSTRDTALRLGLVTRDQMLSTLMWAILHPPDGMRVIEVPEIRQIGRRATSEAPASSLHA